MIGLRAGAGAPEEIIGIEIAALDGEKQRLELVLRSGLEPCLTRFHVSRPSIWAARSRYHVAVENTRPLIALVHAQRVCQPRPSSACCSPNSR